MSEFKSRFANLRQEVMSKDRKEFIDKMLMVKRAKVMEGISNNMVPVSTTDEEDKDLADCINQERELFSSLSKSKGAVTEEFFKILEYIRLLVSKREKVPIRLLDVFITPRFLKMIIDFINYGKEDQIDLGLYAKSLYELLWIIVNLFTTQSYDHENIIIDSNIIEVLVDCFRNSNHPKVSTDMLLAFGNFIVGGKQCKIAFERAGLQEALEYRFSEVFKGKLGSEVGEWFYIYSVLALQYVSTEPVTLPNNALNLMMSISEILKHVQISSSDEVYKFFAYMKLYCSSLKPIEIQAIINMRFEARMFEMLCIPRDEQEAEYIALTARKLTSGFDLNMMIEVYFNYFRISNRYA